jgi:hypothetical protein
MKRTKWIIAAVVVLLILAVGVVFYRSVYNAGKPQNLAGFANDLVMPDAITLTDKVNKPLAQGSNLREGELQISDKIVVKTIFIEVGKSSFTKATKADKEDISDTQRAFSIGMVYSQNAPQSNRLTTIEVLPDGTFYTSKIVNGKEQYAKGKFSEYTMNYLVGLYTIR